MKKKNILGMMVLAFGAGLMSGCSIPQTVR